MTECICMGLLPCRPEQVSETQTGCLLQIWWYMVVVVVVPPCRHKLLSLLVQWLLSLLPGRQGICMRKSCRGPLPFRQGASG